MPRMSFSASETWACRCERVHLSKEPLLVVCRLGLYLELISQVGQCALRRSLRRSRLCVLLGLVACHRHHFGKRAFCTRLDACKLAIQQLELCVGLMSPCLPAKLLELVLVVPPLQLQFKCINVLQISAKSDPRENARQRQLKRDAPHVILCE